MTGKKLIPLFIIFILIVFSNPTYGQLKPVLSNIEVTPLAYTEGDPPVNITSTINVSDPDDTNLDSAIIRIRTNYQNSEDRLNFTNTFFITGTWNQVTGILKLTGSTTIANYRTALRNVRYENTNTDNPSTALRTVDFRVHDGDNYSDSVQRNITVTRINDAPVLSAIEGTAVTYTENAAPVILSSLITVTDVDDDNMESATIQITGNYASTQDVLGFTSVGGILGTWYPATGTLSLTGTSSKANYNTALRSVTYQNTSENPSTAARTVTFMVNDGDINSNPRTRNINVTAVNDAPVLSGIETIPLSYTEGSPPVIITSSIVVTDVDNNNMVSATVHITGNYDNQEDILTFTNIYNITGSWNSGLGRLTLSNIDTKEHYQEALRSVRYSNTDTENPSTLTRTVTFRIYDGNLNSNEPTRDITIGLENDPPVLSGIEPAPVTYTEGNPAVILTSSIVVTDIDDDNIELASLQMTTNYLSTEDRLNFTSTPNITGTWNPTTGILLLTGTDTKANYQAALRSVTYVNTNLDKPSTLLRTVTFTVNDGDANSNTLLKNIIVTGVNDAPELSGIEATPLSYTEDQGPLKITNTLLVTDVDSDNILSATIRIASNYLLSEDTLVFTNTPAITGTWTDNTGTLTLTGPDTKANFQAALRNVSYINTNTGNPSLVVRTVSFRVNDGTANSNTVTRNITITRVNDPPVLSGIEVTSLSYTEGSGEVPITATLQVRDPDDDNIESATIQITGNYINTEDTLVFTNTASITSSWNQFTGTLTLTGSATKASYLTALRNVRYKNKDTLNIAAIPRTVRFIVSDGDVISNMQSRIIIVSEQNDPPTASNVVISGSRTVYSNLTGLYTYDDPEGDPEGNSTYKWSRSNFPNGASPVDIAGATGKNYTTKYIDGGKYLSFGVKPIDNRGAISPVTYSSPWVYINAGPTAQNLSIKGAKALNQTDTADFTYYDLENDPENPVNHYYQWFRADNASGLNKVAIVGATHKTYTININDDNKYISVEVSPAA